MIIKSILDNDLYKFTMQHAVIRKFPNVKVRSTLKIRTDVDFPEGFSDRVRSEIFSMSTLKLNKKEWGHMNYWCGSFLPPVYLDFLSGYRFNPDEVTVNQVDNKISLTIEAPWYRQILWEPPLMAIISETYFDMMGFERIGDDTMAIRNKTKMETLENLNANFMDFGTRRRYSYETHKAAVDASIKHAPIGFMGTSNALISMELGCPVKGTVAHEWYMVIAAMFGYNNANEIANKTWKEVYGEYLNIQLPDTFTTEVFLSTFTKRDSESSAGLRQDSGVPLRFVDKMLNYYNVMRINPRSKIIAFSNSLNLKSADEILHYCDDNIKPVLCFGTYFSNDVDVTPLNMVIKVTHVQFSGEHWVPTVKLGDGGTGKYTGSPDDIAICKLELKLK